MPSALEPVAVAPALPQPVGREQTSLTDQTRSLRLNVLWAFAGNVSQAAAQWGMLVALTKLVDPEGVGHFALGLAVAAPLILLTNLELRSIQATDARREFSFPNYLGLRLVASCLALLAIGAVLLIGDFSRAAGVVILAMAVRKIFESGSDIFYGFFQQHERMDIIAKSMMLNSALALVAFVPVVYLSRSVFWAMVAWAITCALTLIIFDVRYAWAMIQTSGSRDSSSGSAATGLRQLLVANWDTGSLLKLARLAAPMGFVMMVFSLNMNIPRYFIGGQLGERELGIFAAMAYPFVAGNYMVNALGHSANPRLARHFATGDTASFCSMLLKLLAVTAVTGAMAVGGVILLGKSVLSLLYTVEYAQHVDTFLWLTIAAVIGFMSTILSQALTAARCLRQQAFLSSGVVLITLVACALLVERQGLKGAAVALMIAAAVRWVGGVLVIARALWQQQALTTVRMTQ